jgi:hypothetical protein
MNLSAIVKKYTEEIGGQFTEYSESLMVVIMPLSGGRFQTVLGTIKENELYNRKLIAFSSKVSPYQPNIDFKMLLEQTAYFNYCRFVIKEGYVQVEAVAAYDSITEGPVKEMLQEVANLADQYEMRLTGVDVN